MALTFMVRHPFSQLKMSQILAWLLKLLICLYKYSLHEKLTKNMGPHCTVRLEHLLVAFWSALTLEPIKCLCTISTMRLVFLLDGLDPVTFRGCAIRSSGGSWSTILFGWAVCGTLGGGFLEKPFTF